MYRAARFATVMAYLYSILFGVIAFTYDLETGYVTKKTPLTTYCLLINFLTVSCVIYFGRNMELKMESSDKPDLHNKILVALTFIRILGVSLTLVNNWWRRDEFIHNLNTFKAFRERFLRKHSTNKRYEEYFNQQIVLKFGIGALCEVIMFYGSVRIMRQIFSDFCRHTVFGLMSTVLNLMACHYFFIALSVRILFCIIADELRRLLTTMENLFADFHTKCIGPGLLSVKSCQLADEFDDLSGMHTELQVLSEKINSMFYVQGCCVFLILYLNNICVLYIYYMLAKQVELGPQFSHAILYFLPLALLLYYADGYMLIDLVLRYMDAIEMPAQLLKDCAAWLPILDRRLEESVKLFSLKMAAFPVSRSLLYLFDVTRPMVFATITSTITNAIVLVQYDYQYNET
ncbi:putative gustatory receptor 36c [Musca domestica]|uniref:Gustatory receptor n=1 Tax=Musca domestica TaxID=7370 RepID=A0A9J7DC28_MUSDO|nr:putative gustatory receptor 36c [Musca domestica]